MCEINLKLLRFRFVREILAHGNASKYNIKEEEEEEKEEEEEDRFKYTISQKKVRS